MGTATIMKIPARGKVEFTQVATDDETGRIPLKAIQDGVGGWIERVFAPGFGDIDFFANEEGKLNGLSFNPVATALTGIANRGDCIVGDVFVCCHDEDGNSVGLDDKDELLLMKRLRRLGL